MEKFCPSCGRGYDLEVDRCEDDNERLVLLNEEPSLVGTQLEGNYDITAELGHGGMGSVYLAHQSSMDREVAIKVLRRQFSQNKLAIKRFLREARAASKLAHPNTITVYDFGQSDNGLLYMVMEKLQGRSLASIMDQEGRVAPARAVRILAQACDSLAEAHSQGITHRDLKPENIFVEPKFGNPEFVKVLDFGIAKMNDEPNTQATATGMICGTPSYMSPEQAMGKQIDGRSDIYALGILLYEMIASRRPYDGETAMEVMLKHLNETPPELDPDIDCPTALKDLIFRMLAKRADERPENCSELKALMLSAVGDPNAAAALAASGLDPISGSRRTGRKTADAITSFDKRGLGVETLDPRRSARVKWALAAAAVLAVGAIGVVLAQGDLGKTPVAAPAQPRVPKVASVEVPAAPAPVPTAKPEATAKAGAALDPLVVEKVGVDPKEPQNAQPTAPAPVVETPPAPTPTPAAQLVKLTVASKPEGAEVFEGEALLGTTPLMLERPKNSGTVELKVVKKGFKSETFVLGTAATLTKDVTLEKPAGIRRPARPGSPGGDDGGIGTF
jgi:serine/threonine-protein kinase